MFDFINLSFVDILDIILVGLLIYEMIRLIKGTAAMGIFVGILIIYLAWIVVRAFHMELLSSIIGQILGVGVIALIVIFQQEIRHFLFRLGNRYDPTKRGFFSRLFKHSKGQGISAEALEEITAACRKMSETKTGALIVMPHEQGLQSVVETGDELHALINRRLIENIFFKNTPLHDGAMIMTSNRIVAARCTLPVSESMSIPPRYGMRHRAAVGITEQTDATVIVVSEETGEITFVADGQMKTMGSITELRLAIENSYSK
jgi:TIGR00159 family protein